MNLVLVVAMSFGDIAELIWSTMNSTAGIVFMAGVLLYGLNKLYASKPLWSKYEGAIFTAIRLAEKKIDDNTENKGLAKLDDALEYVLKVYEESNNKKASVKVKAELKEGIAITHDRMSTR